MTNDEHAQPAGALQRDSSFQVIENQGCNGCYGCVTDGVTD
jgi:hypothetical protein